MEGARNPNTLNIRKILKEADKLYSEKKYNRVIEKYTILIELCPNDPIMFYKRALCYWHLKNPLKALGDCKRSVELSPEFIRGHGHLIFCAMKLHQFEEVDCTVEKLKAIDPTNKIIEYQAQKRQDLALLVTEEENLDANIQLAKKIECINKCLEICPYFLPFKAKKAVCLTIRQDFKEAEELASEVLAQDPDNSDCHYVLGTCLYQNDIEKSVNHFERAFELNSNLNCDKDHKLYKRAKRFLEKTTEANNAYSSGKISQAYDIYQNLIMECMGHKTMLMTLFFNMAQASYKLGNLEQCLDECGVVFGFKSDLLGALILRAQCNFDLKNFEEAIKYSDAALSINASAEVSTILHQASRLLEAQRTLEAPNNVSNMNLEDKHGVSTNPGD